MMTVFITQELRGKDLTDAIAFGSLEIILAAEEQITDSDKKTELVDKIESVLAKFGDDDYLLLSGDPAAIGLSFAIALLNNQGKIRILKWDRLRETYYSVSLEIEIGAFDE
jgi:hypothetical protein